MHSRINWYLLRVPPIVFSVKCRLFRARYSTAHLKKNVWHVEHQNRNEDFNCIEIFNLLFCVWTPCELYVLDDKYLALLLQICLATNLFWEYVWVVSFVSILDLASTRGLSELKVALPLNYKENLIYKKANILFQEVPSICNLVAHICIYYFTILEITRSLYDDTVIYYAFINIRYKHSAYSVLYIAIVPLQIIKNTKKDLGYPRFYIWYVYLSYTVIVCSEWLLYLNKNIPHY